MIYRNLLLLLIAVGTLIGSTSPKPEIAADHHIHIRSEAGTDALQKVLKQVKGQAGAKLKPAVDADQVVAMLDSTGTRKASLLSTAYFFGMPEMDFQDKQNKVRQENRYVARQAAQYPKRLAAFCGVNPLAEYAIEEIQWCGEKDRFAGLKLHLANSDVDLRDEQDVQKMARVFRAASAQDLAIIIHLWTRNPDYGARDVEIFVNQIMPEARGVTVQVAHLGGPGRFSKVTNTVAQTFADLVQQKDASLGNLYFDLAAVPLNPARAEGKRQQKQIQKRNQQLTNRIRELGADHVLWGTDWIAGPFAAYRTKLQAVPFGQDLKQKILGNTAPYL